jgi:hypothetical protein
MRKLSDDLNAGAPVPTVDPEELKHMWLALKKLQSEIPGEVRALGLGAIAGAGHLLKRDPTESDYMSFMMRASILQSLLDRQVLRDFDMEEERANSVFQAAATIPLNKDDLGEALMQQRLSEQTAEEAAKVKAAWRAEGYDPDRPLIDLKFLDFMQQIDR